MGAAGGRLFDLVHDFLNLSSDVDTTIHLYIFPQVEGGGVLYAIIFFRRGVSLGLYLWFDVLDGG